jgi:EAL and modified HD-GYP domain-containing signal transduction protein
MSHLHLARQPIFNRDKSVFAYELLYKPDESDIHCEDVDLDEESMRVLTAGFLGANIDTITGGKPAIVKFTQMLLQKGVATIFPKEQLFIDIDQSVEPTDALIEALRNLKKSDYRLVFTVHTLESLWNQLLDFADIIRVDFKSVNQGKHRLLVREFSERPAAYYLAYGIENEAEFVEANRLGYSLFQGYFFTRPSDLSIATVPVSKLNVILLLKELVQYEPDTERIRTAIEMDVGLTFDILKLVNSAYFYKRKKIDSIRQALAYLGLEGIKKWVMLSSLAMKNDANGEAVELSIIRSRFMEHLGMLFVFGAKVEEYTLTGLFSLLEVLTSCPYSVLFEHISVPDEVFEILVHGRRDMLMGQCFELVEHYEKGNFVAAGKIAEKLGFTFDQVDTMYKASVHWLNENRTMLYNNDF